MNKIIKKLNLLHDSNLIDLYRNNSNLIMKLNSPYFLSSFNEKNVLLKFIDVNYFIFKPRDNNVDNLSDLNKISNFSLLFIRALDVWENEIYISFYWDVGDKYKGWDFYIKFEDIEILNNNMEKLI